MQSAQCLSICCHLKPPHGWCNGQRARLKCDRSQVRVLVGSNQRLLNWYLCWLVCWPRMYSVQIIQCRFQGCYDTPSSLYDTYCKFCSRQYYTPIHTFDTLRYNMCSCHYRCSIYVSLHLKCIVLFKVTRLYVLCNESYHCFYNTMCSRYTGVERQWILRKHSVTYSQLALIIICPRKRTADSSVFEPQLFIRVHWKLPELQIIPCFRRRWVGMLLVLLVLQLTSFTHILHTV